MSRMHCSPLTGLDERSSLDETHYSSAVLKFTWHQIPFAINEQTSSPNQLHIHKAGHDPRPLLTEIGNLSRPTYICHRQWFHTAGMLSTEFPIPLGFELDKPLLSTEDILRSSNNLPPSGVPSSEAVAAALFAASTGTQTPTTTAPATPKWIVPSSMVAYESLLRFTFVKGCFVKKQRQPHQQGDSDDNNDNHRRDVFKRSFGSVPLSFDVNKLPAGAGPIEPFPDSFDCALTFSIVDRFATSPRRITNVIGSMLDKSTLSTLHGFHLLHQRGTNQGLNDDEIVRYIKLKNGIRDTQSVVESRIIDKMYHGLCMKVDPTTIQSIATRDDLCSGSNSMTCTVELKGHKAMLKVYFYAINIEIPPSSAEKRAHTSNAAAAAAAAQTTSARGIVKEFIIVRKVRLTLKPEDWVSIYDIDLSKVATRGAIPKSFLTPPTIQDMLASVKQYYPIFDLCATVANTATMATIETSSASVVTTTTKRSTTSSSPPSRMNIIRQIMKKHQIDPIFIDVDQWCYDMASIILSEVFGDAALSLPMSAKDFANVQIAVVASKVDYYITRLNCIVNSHTESRYLVAQFFQLYKTKYFTLEESIFVLHKIDPAYVELQLADIFNAIASLFIDDLEAMKVPQCNIFVKSVAMQFKNLVHSTLKFSLARHVCLHEMISAMECLKRNGKQQQQPSSAATMVPKPSHCFVLGHSLAHPSSAEIFKQMRTVFDSHPLTMSNHTNPATASTFVLSSLVNGMTKFVQTTTATSTNKPRPLDQQQQQEDSCCPPLLGKCLAPPFNHIVAGGMFKQHPPLRPLYVLQPSPSPPPPPLSSLSAMEVDSFVPPPELAMETTMDDGVEEVSFPLPATPTPSYHHLASSSDFGPEFNMSSSSSMGVSGPLEAMMNAILAQNLTSVATTTTTTTTTAASHPFVPIKMEDILPK